MRRLTVIFFGDVQGVGFRRSTLKKALALQIKGTVENLDDGSVKGDMEGDLSSLFSLIETLAASFSLTKSEIYFETSLKGFMNFSIL